MIHYKKILLIGLVVIFLSPWTASADNQTLEERERTKEKTNLLIEYMSQNCRLKAPEVVCECVVDVLKKEATKSDYQISDADLKETLKKSTYECMLSTGFVRSMMNQASLVCYTDDLKAIPAKDRNIEFLKSAFPEKIEQCMCFQQEIDNIDERTFMELSIRARKRFQNRVNCMKLEKTEDECWKEFPDESASKMAEIEKKCGL